MTQSAEKVMDGLQPMDREQQRAAYREADEVRSPLLILIILLILILFFVVFLMLLLLLTPLWCVSAGRAPVGGLGEG